MTQSKYRCRRCLLRGDECPEIVMQAEEQEIAVDDWIESEDPSFDGFNGQFLCGDCFILGDKEDAPIVPNDKIKMPYDKDY